LAGTYPRKGYGDGDGVFYLALQNNIMLLCFRPELSLITNCQIFTRDFTDEKYFTKSNICSGA
jgi:hypothetical protein